MMLPDEMIQEIARKYFMFVGDDVLGFARELMAAIEAKDQQFYQDAARLDWVIYHGVGFRKDPRIDHSGEWYLSAPYHTRISCVDGVHRFKSARDAVDAAMAEKQGKTK